MSTTVSKPANAAKPADSGELSHRQIMTILYGLMIGMFLAALDQMIVATAIRTIGDDLHGLAAQAWVTTAFLITSTIATPLFGKLSDIYGRKPLFMIAITIFVTGSALCGLAQSMYMLAAFRAFQGIGAGGLIPLALAIIGDIIPPRERAKYQGYFMAVFASASVLGPVVGGFLAGQASVLGITGWRWIFYINVPIGALALVVVAKVLHLRHVRRDHRIDWAGASMLALALVPLLIIAEQGRSWGWDSPAAFACYLLGLAGIIGFIWVETRMGDDALLPIRLFRGKVFPVGSAQSFVIGMGMFGGMACIPLYLQIVKGASPTEAGLMLLPMTLGIMGGSIVSGQLISRTGRYRHFPIIGSALLAVSLFVFHYVHADTPLWQTMIVMVFFGIGLGFNFQPLTLAVQNAVSPQSIGVATSSATFTRQIGGTMGTAVFLSILFSTVPGKIATAMEQAVRSKDFQAALHDPANAAFAQQFQASQQAGGTGAAGGVLKDSSFLNTLDPRLAKPFLEGFSNAMDLVFLVGSVVMVIGFFVMLFLPHVELRSGSAYSERGKTDAANAEAAEAAAAAAPPAISH
jgi:EmrB/QacA subfamily drug resistance transporter